MIIRWPKRRIPLKKRHKFGIALGILLLLLLATAIVLQTMAREWVVDYLDRKIPDHLTLEYNKLSVNLLKGSVRFDTISLQLAGRSSDTVYARVNLNRIDFRDFSYLKLLRRETIGFKEIRIVSPNIVYFPGKMKPRPDSSATGVVNLLKNIEIGETIVEEGSFLMWDREENDTLLSIPRFSFNLQTGQTDPGLISKRIPLTYGSYSFTAAEIYMDLGLHEELKVDSVSAASDGISANGLTLLSKYEKHKQVERAERERDHVTFSLPELKTAAVDFGFQFNRFYLKTPLVELIAPHLELYRDKSLPDDPRKKNMYSQMLRELPFDLSIDSLRVENGFLQYEEREPGNQVAGQIHFDSLDAGINRLGNTYPDSLKTIVNTEALFMGSSPMTLAYIFHPSDSTESFLARGSLSGFHDPSVNDFLKPNARVMVEGSIDQMYYTISGDDYVSTGDMKMKYRNFKLTVLKKDKGGVNKLLTILGNIFINDGGRTDDDGFRYGKIYTERDLNRSFFNYLWKNIQDGMLKTMTGDGKKE